MARKRASSRSRRKGGGRRRRRRKSPWGRRIRVLLFLVVVLGVGASAAFLLSLHADVREFVRSRSFDPVRVYSAPFRLRSGLDVAESGLRRRLERLGYRRVSGRPDAAGEFRWGAGSIELYLNGFTDPLEAQLPGRVRLGVEGGRVRSLRGPASGEPALEPEMIGAYAGGVLAGRAPVNLEALPEHVVQAVLAAEDARFFEHHGVDPFGVLRALWVNLRSGEIRQGGSTLTQQLAKNVFLTAERSWSRKIPEVLLAILLEAQMPKEAILEEYLNAVYLGRIGSVPVHGFGAAARVYFGKEATELSLAEAATLAGMIRAPNAYSPLRHPERARERCDQVLAGLGVLGWIDEARLESARQETVRAKRNPGGALESPFYVNEVFRRLARMGYAPARVRGLSVYTGMDREAQRIAEQAVRGGLARLEERVPRLERPASPLESAAVVLDARTGFVRALVGGRDFARSQFNRATRARRQPGSAFKPFVYLAALDDPKAGITAATHLDDEPLRVRTSNGDWRPDNYDQRFLGEVTVRRALEESRNVPTVRLALRIGPERIARLAGAAGLGDMDAVPALALGVEEVSLLELVAAYTTFPNGGRAVPPALLRGIVTQEGRVLYRDRLHSRPVATPAATFVATDLLRGVVERGTGRAVRRYGVDGPVAGKTGTSNEERDAWFVGFSPSLVAGVWVGFDEGDPVGLTGAGAALPIWAEIARPLFRFTRGEAFERPDGVVLREIDAGTGLLAGHGCPGHPEVFVVGTAPERSCDGGRPERAVRDGWRKLEGWIKGALDLE